MNSAAFMRTLGLEQLCTKNTKRLFSTLGLSQISTFLAMDPSEWDEEETFQEALRIINGLAVVNDRAERGVALIQEFNKKLTSGEEQLQFPLQIVSDHRRKFPDCSMCQRMRVPRHHYIYINFNIININYVIYN